MASPSSAWVLAPHYQASLHTHANNVAYLPACVSTCLHIHLPAWLQSNQRGAPVHDSSVHSAGSGSSTPRAGLLGVGHDSGAAADGVEMDGFRHGRDEEEGAASAGGEGGCNR